MKNRLVFVLVGIALLSSCKNECKKVKETYPNGKPKTVFIYPDCSDTTCFQVQHFNDMGLKYDEGYIRNGKEDGLFKTWYDNGKQSAEWEMRNGKGEGYVQCWYEDGKLKKTAFVDNDLENGLVRTCSENGNWKSEGYVLNDKRNGPWVNLRKDGQWNIRTYKYDMLEGPTIEYNIDSTGNFFVIGQYENDKESGLWKWYDNDTILYQAIMYGNGFYNGEFMDYYKNGKISVKGVYKNNEYEGAVYSYDESGKLLQIDKYANGKLIK
jgi:antitoxin component YwqK of YwqJK toxin-antitoxin module